MTNFRDTHPVPELLAPAGGPEPFRAALAAGADAIYCGLGNDFNARRGAHNFTDDEFAEACRAAHLAGARVYVTLNIVIKTAEIPQALALVRRAWLLGADAFIIQDWGLIAEVRRRWPQIEVHLSTQANVHDARATAWCRDLGISRVTLSRELSVAEIARIAETGEELESFGHGALCFCYSGVCMMSSLAGGRSANRGLCAQPCRLLYDLVDEEGRPIEAPGRTRPLCPKDYCTIDDLERLTEAGLGSLKVEGRMKAPDYVWATISSYRAQLDDLAAGRKPAAAEERARHERLKRAFNRDFTDSYLDRRSDDDMMSYERSNNRGELVGTVVSSRDLGTVRLKRGGSQGGRERFRSKNRAEVEVLLDRHVDEGDLLEIRPLDDPSQFLTAHANHDAAAGETIVCRTVRPMAAGDPVRVIRSQRALDEASRVAKGGVVRKRPVTVKVVARLGQPFSVTLSTSDGAAKATAEGFTVEPARTKAVTREDLVEHVGRMGSTPFEPVGFVIDMDEGCGMGFSAVHKVRAEAAKRLEEALLEPYAERGQAIGMAPDADAVRIELREVRREAGIPLPDGAALRDPEVCALVTTPEDAVLARAAGATRVYATADALATGDWGGAGEVIPWLDEVCREIDHDHLDPWIQEGRPVGVGNMSELVLARERGACAEVRPCIPVHNEGCLVALEDAGAQGIWLSPELTLDEACALGRAASVPMGLIVLGRTRAMTSEHCVLQAADRCIHDCPRCKLRRRRLSLRDHDGALLPVRTDIHGRSRIYAAHPLDATPQAGELIASGVTRLMADCTLLSGQEVAFAVEHVARAVAAAKQGRKPAPRLNGYSSGHLFTGIG